MLSLVRLGAAITESLDHTNAPSRRGCGRERPQTQTRTVSVSSGGRLDHLNSLRLPYGCTVVLWQNADSLLKHQY